MKTNQPAIINQLGGLLLLALAMLTAPRAAAQTPSFATLYSFKGNADGAQPYGGVILGNGALYGTTYFGGANQCSGTDGTFGCGTVFELAPVAGGSWTKLTLHSFNGGDGSQPRADLVFATTGALYGTTVNGGSGDHGGTVFELAPPSTAGTTWTETVLYSFPGGHSLQGAPWGAVVIGPSGSLYSTTSGGYGLNYGTVFKLSPPAAPGDVWTEVTLVAFLGQAGNPGTNPGAGVVFASGSLYGTTYLSGIGGYGTVYELAPPASKDGTWTETTIHSFTGPPNDGAGSLAALTAGPGGVLYGTTVFGGSGTACSFSGPGCGTVFQLTPPTTPGGSWTETVIYSFTGVSGDGAGPNARLTLTKNGVLYGTTSAGGSSGIGAVFRLKPPAAPGGAWTETVLHSFTGQNGDSSIPLAGLAISPSGTLYGTTQLGGTSGFGTIFAIKP